MARTLAGAMRRPADYLARYGGEEFVCQLPNTDHAGAYEVAGEMIEAIRRRALPHGTSPVAASVTVSIGCASLVPDDGNHPDALLEIADTALYMAKNGGRDRHVCSPGGASPDPTSGPATGAPRRDAEAPGERKDAQQDVEG